MLVARPNKNIQNKRTRETVWQWQTEFWKRNQVADSVFWNVKSELRVLSVSAKNNFLLKTANVTSTVAVALWPFHLPLSGGILHRQDEERPARVTKINIQNASPKVRHQTSCKKPDRILSTGCVNLIFASLEPPITRQTTYSCFQFHEALSIYDKLPLRVGIFISSSWRLKQLHKSVTCLHLHWREEQS